MKINDVLANDMVKQFVSQEIQELANASGKSVEEIKELALKQVGKNIIEGNFDALPDEYKNLARLKDRIEAMKAKNMQNYDTYFWKMIFGAVRASLLREIRNKPMIGEGVIIDITEEGIPRDRNGKKVYSYTGIAWGKITDIDGTEYEPALITFVMDSNNDSTNIRRGDKVKMHLQKVGRGNDNAWIVENRCGKFYRTVMQKAEKVGQTDITDIILELYDKYTPLKIAEISEVLENPQNPYIIAGTIIDDPSRAVSRNNFPWGAVEIIDDSVKTFEGASSIRVMLPPWMARYGRDSSVWIVVRISRANNPSAGRTISVNGMGIIPEYISTELEPFNFKDELKRMQARAGATDVAVQTTMAEDALDDEDDEDEEEDLTVPPDRVAQSTAESETESEDIIDL